MQQSDNRPRTEDLQSLVRRHPWLKESIDELSDGLKRHRTGKYRRDQAECRTIFTQLVDAVEWVLKAYLKYEAPQGSRPPENALRNMKFHQLLDAALASLDQSQRKTVSNDDLSTRFGYFRRRRNEIVHEGARIQPADVDSLVETIHDLFKVLFGVDISVDGTGKIPASSWIIGGISILVCVLLAIAAFVLPPASPTPTPGATPSLTATPSPSTTSTPTARSSAPTATFTPSATSTSTATPTPARFPTSTPTPSPCDPDYIGIDFAPIPDEVDKGHWYPEPGYTLQIQGQGACGPFDYYIDGQLVAADDSDFEPFIYVYRYPIERLTIEVIGRVVARDGRFVEQRLLLKRPLQP